MADSTQADVAADVLAVAVQKAITLERERAEREIALAVKTAKREAQVEYRLAGHESRLNAINGSIRKTGESIDSLKEHIVKRDVIQDKRNTEADTAQAIHWKTRGQAFSRRQVIAGYVSIAAIAASPLIAELVSILFHT